MVDLSSKVFMKDLQLQAFLLLTVQYLSQLTPFFPERQWFKIHPKHKTNDRWQLTVAIVCLSNQVRWAAKSEQLVLSSVLLWAVANFVQCLFFLDDHVERYVFDCLESGKNEVVIKSCTTLQEAKAFLVQNEPGGGADTTNYIWW